MRSGTRVRHETPHLARPQAPTPKEKQSPTIPTTSTNRNPNKQRCQSGPIARRSCKFFFQHIVCYSSLTLDQTNTKIRQGARSGKPPSDPKTPQMKQKPQIAQNAIPQAKLQPPTPIKLLFDFSLIYTVLRKAGNKAEQESPVPPKALLSKHHSSPQHSQNGPEKRQVWNPQETRNQSH